MRIYVATKWEEKERAREVMAALQEAGHTITYDWTRCDVNDQNQAESDRQGVLTADALVAIFEKDLRYSGALAEFGMALAQDIPVYVLGNSCDNNIFMKLPKINRGIDNLIKKEQIAA